MFDLLKHGENPCLVGDERSYSYFEIHKEVLLIKPFLGDRSLILCLCENSIPSLVGYISFMVHDQVPILVEGAQKTEVLLNTIANYLPDYIWAQNSRLDSLPEGEVIYRLETYVLLKLANPSNAGSKVNDQLQMLLTTSGSTGSSKFVRLSRDNLIANAASIIEYLQICAEDVAPMILPYSYSFGLSIINTHLLAGASIIVSKLTPLSKDFWELVQQKRITSLSGVPYTFEMLKRIKFERFELNSIRYLSQAGGKMTKEGLDYLRKVSMEKGWRCFVMYGQTEATARMSYLPAECFDLKLGCIGRPVPGGNFSIIDVAGNNIKSSFIQGELVYTGANVAMGYATGKEDLTRGDDWNGTLQTGDIGYRDEQGFYYITGRLKRFIKIFGNRVSLDEVEVLLQTAFSDCEFICLGYDDCLKISYKGEVSRDELVAYVSRQLGIHRSAIKCNEITEIPRLSNGKVNYGSFIQ